MYIILHLLKLMRPHQWTKNLFVFTGLIFGHAWADSSLVQAVILSAVAFSLLSSGVYIVNDIVDAESDRQHPKKKFRPIAAGNVAITLAASWALLLVVVAFGLAWLVSTEVIMLLLAYLILNAAYSAGLKQVAVLDVFLIATGFMLRILVGTEGVGIAPSQWLLLCGLMITLFLGFTKRRAELMVAEESGMTTRKVLSQYDAGLLDTFIAITATAAVLAYSLYTVNPETIAIHGTANLIYTVPFVAYGIFRYILRLHTHRRGEDPARELVTDPHIIVTVLSWVIVVLWLIG
ncbi:MAG: decaprenyl-phosphate phosphoribosyltransferase [Acidiferrobacterales bacterium]|jgi:4-hydroxybenzoate polyprenyltransferase|nr:decaprenyl-phosphate phosphoribosyltransferase [Acidiferrobacterales bacterium]